RRCRPLDGSRGRLAMAHGKEYRAADSKISREKKYSMDEAFTLLPEMKISAKFDETVDLAIRLGVDPKHADQMVRGAVNLPHGTGKTTRVVVFAKGDKAKEAQEAGADAVGAGPRREDHQGELARVRLGRLHAGPHGSRRPSRPRARSARPHAEPEGGHRDLRR